MGGSAIDFTAIPGTAIRVVTSPAAFYRGMPKKGGYAEPLVFMLVMGVVAGLLQAAFSLLGLRLAQGAAAGVAAIVLVPVAVLVGGFVGAAILFVVWKLMGSQEDYETAYRCGAYAAAFSPIIAVLGLIPYAGMAVGTVIWVFLLVTASVEVHGIQAGRAWLVFGIIGAFFVVMGITSELAARRLAGQMKETSRQMQDAAQQMRERALEQADQARQDADRAREAGDRHLEESIRRMEEQMKNMPPEQQEQMRAAIEEMKKARGQE